MTSGCGCATACRKVGKLAFHPFLRSGFDFGQQPRRLFAVAPDSGTTCAYQVGASCFMTRAIAGLLPPCSKLSSASSKRQVGFRSRQALRTTPARNRALMVGRKLREKVFDQRRLADPRLARDAQQRSAPRRASWNAARSSATLPVAPDGVATGTARGCAVAERGASRPSPPRPVASIATNVCAQLRRRSDAGVASFSQHLQESDARGPPAAAGFNVGGASARAAMMACSTDQRGRR